MIYSEDCSLNDDYSSVSAAAAAVYDVFELFDCWIYHERWYVEIIVEVGASFLEER